MIFSRDRNFYKTFNSLYWILILHNIITFSVNLADNVMIGSYSETALSGVAASEPDTVYLSADRDGVRRCCCCNMQSVLGTGTHLRNKENNRKRALYGGGVLGHCFCGGKSFPLSDRRTFYNVSGDCCAGKRIYKNHTLYIPAVCAYEHFSCGAEERRDRSYRICCIGYDASYKLFRELCSDRRHFGAPELGVTGAAIGTLAARFVEFAVVVVYVFFIDKKLRSKLSDLLRPGIAAVRDYLKNMWRFTLVGAMFGVSTALQTVVLGHMQDAAIAGKFGCDDFVSGA